MSEKDSETGSVRRIQRGAFCLTMYIFTACPSFVSSTIQNAADPGVFAPSSGKTSVTFPFLGSRYLSIDLNVTAPYTPVLTVGPIWDPRRFSCMTQFNWTRGAHVTCRLPANMYGHSLHLFLNNFDAVACNPSSDTFNISAPEITPMSLVLASAPSIVQVKIYRTLDLLCVILFLT